MAHHVQQDRAQFIRLRVPRKIRGAVVGVVAFDVFGADRWAHKDEVVVEVTAVQDFGGHRVEKGFGQLGLVVIDQQANEMQLDLLPNLHGLLVRFELALQAGGAFFDAQVVKRDALALGALLAVPIGGFKAVLGARRFGAEQAVMVVEAIHHGFGDVVGQ